MQALPFDVDQALVRLVAVDHRQLLVRGLMLAVLLLVRRHGRRRQPVHVGADLFASPATLTPRQVDEDAYRITRLGRGGTRATCPGQRRKPHSARHFQAVSSVHNSSPILLFTAGLAPGSSTR